MNGQIMFLKNKNQINKWYFDDTDHILYDDTKYTKSIKQWKWMFELYTSTSTAAECDKFFLLFKKKIGV